VRVLFIILILSQYSIARELYQSGLPPRCMAMGGTCISHIRGSQALFFNAATLARVEGFDMTLGQFTAGASKDAQSYVDAIQNNSGNTLSINDVQGLYGKTLTADVAARSSIVMPFFGFGVYSQNYLIETFSNPTFPTFNMNYISDYGYTVAAALPLGPATSFGIAGRSVKRWGGNKDIDILTLVNSTTQNIIDSNFPDHGVGTALDLSVMTTLPTDLKPTFAIVWNDVGTTRYQMTKGNQDPPTQQDNLIFGSSIKHDFLGATWTHALEYKFIRTNGEDLSKKVHLGTEASFGVIDLRAGLNQGYLTYGVGVDLWFLQLDATYFSNEQGSYAGQSRNDRYQVGVAVTLDFDQSFKLQDMEGKKRRLKQRR
jgi:hypothetical protein